MAAPLLLLQDIHVTFGNTALLDGAATETGFSPDESRMLKNILSLRERRLDDLMVPRADIVAVQQDIALGELLKVYANQGHSRLVVYGDTLDDPIGMVHIRDLIASMTAHAGNAAAKPGTKRRKPLPAEDASVVKRPGVGRAGQP